MTNFNDHHLHDQLAIVEATGQALASIRESHAILYGECDLARKSMGYLDLLSQLLVIELQLITGMSGTSALPGEDPLDVMRGVSTRREMTDHTEELQDRLNRAVQMLCRVRDNGMVASDQVDACIAFVTAPLGEDVTL